jgi:hypothetical protein
MQTRMLPIAALIVAAFSAQAGAGEVVSAQGLVSAIPVAADMVAVRVKSVHGWSCEGLYDEPERPGAAVKFPLDCSDDVKGKALMSIEGGRAALLFQREDGSKGTAAVTLY